MKYLKAVIVLAVVLLAALPVWAEEKTETRDPAKLIPLIKVGEATLDLWGFAQGAFIENAEPDEFQWTNLRLLGSLDGKRLGLGFVFNFSDLQKPDGNWLRELYGKAKLTDNLEVRIGRILHSVGNGNALPGPFRWETILFPKSLPWSQYATGLQLLWNSGQWSAIADITGDSSVRFDDPQSLRNLEFSGRLKRTFRNSERELGWLAGSTQLTKDVSLLGLDWQWQPVKPLTLRGGTFYSDYASEKQSNQLGGFGLAAYRPKHWFEFHTMIDATKDFAKEYQELQEKKDKQGNVVYEEVTRRTSDATEISWTNGVRFFGKDDHWSLTLDYKTVLEGQRGDQISLRVHIPF